MGAALAENHNGWNQTEHLRIENIGTLHNGTIGRHFCSVRYLWAGKVLTDDADSDVLAEAGELLSKGLNQTSSARDSHEEEKTYK